MKIKHISLAFTALVLFFLHTTVCTQDQKITVNLDTEITFGQSAFLSGHFQLYGTIIKTAILACFESINNNGGIHGKKLRLISLDDQGDPEKTKKNVEYLRSLGVTMFIGNMGTRSSLALLPLLEQKKIALFFPWGGDEKLRSPHLSNIVNGLGLLQPQLKALVDHIAGTLKLSQIAIFHADDSFSTDGAHELTGLLKNYNLTPVAQSSYNRFTLDIETPAKKLLEFDPRVVICLTSSMPTVKLINNFFHLGHFGTQFYGIDSTLFVPEILKNRGVPFTYASAVPNPITCKLLIAEQYRNDMKNFFPDQELNAMSFAYYISAKIVTEAIKQVAQTEITQENILTNIERMQNFDLAGFTVTFNRNNRHAFGGDSTLITNN